ncbi:MAG: DUF2188 domain-containing protein, partial [Myxococcales bacterium]|nr:DUF2188 domain-containing protein [Myxococcales bacterium]
MASHISTGESPALLSHLDKQVRERAIKIANDLREQRPDADEGFILAQSAAQALQWKEERDKQLVIQTNPKARTIIVSPHGRQWGVATEGGSDPIGDVYDTRTDAIAAGRDMLSGEGGELVTLDDQGVIDGRESHTGTASRPPTFHVFPHKERGWAVQHAAPKKANRYFETKARAVEYARAAAQDAHSQLVIHNLDGRVSAQHSYTGKGRERKAARTAQGARRALRRSRVFSSCRVGGSETNRPGESTHPNRIGNRPVQHSPGASRVAAMGRITNGRAPSAIVCPRLPGANNTVP